MTNQLKTTDPEKTFHNPIISRLIKSNPVLQFYPVHSEICYIRESKKPVSVPWNRDSIRWQYYGTEYNHFHAQWYLHDNVKNTMELRRCNVRSTKMVIHKKIVFFLVWLWYKYVKHTVNVTLKSKFKRQTRYTRKNAIKKHTRTFKCIVHFYRQKKLGPDYHTGFKD